MEIVLIDVLLPIEDVFVIAEPIDELAIATAMEQVVVTKEAYVLSGAT